MPASSSEARAMCRKRKREYSKPKESEKNHAFEEIVDDEDDPNLDPPQNQLETGDDPYIHTTDGTNRISQEKEREKLVDGGLRICEFPIAIKRVVRRPHSSVFRIVEVERAALNGESSGQGQAGVAVLENISYGQLQVLSAVPRDSPAFIGEETASGSTGGSFVVMPPRIIARGGITKRIGSAGCVHVVPVHSDWFSPNSVHRLERQVVPHFFSGKSAEHTPEKYMETRNCIVAKYVENPDKNLSVADCQRLVAGVDTDDLTQIVRFLDHWGIINYSATPLKHMAQKDGTYLCEDSNNQLYVPSAALKSIDSLIQFDKPKCRLKAINPELACQREEDSDFDSTIRQQLSEHQCNYCSQSIPEVCYQSEKEVDVLLCLDCFHEGRFVAGHSSLDFVKVNSVKDYGDVDGDSWSDQETLLLLEGMQLYNENWNKIEGHVGSKSKAQCILHFVRLPLDCAPLENIDGPSTSGSSNLSSHDNYHESLESNSHGLILQGGDSESNFPFANSGNPVMNLVGFLATALGPRVSAACAHASLASLSKDGSNSVSPHGESIDSSKQDTVRLSAEKVTAAAKDGLAAGAMKAKLFADDEEREIQRLSASIINHKALSFDNTAKETGAEAEAVCRNGNIVNERMRTNGKDETQDRLRTSPHDVDPVWISWSISAHGPTPIVNSTSDHRQQDSGSQLIHPRMSVMQQGIYGLEPGLPPSAIQPSFNAGFNSKSNLQSSLGDPILRPLPGTKSGLG